jgi:hypothetical protein
MDAKTPANPLTCDLCGRPLAAGAYYVVRIDVFADPALPAMSAEELAQGDFAGDIESLLGEMSQMSADELQDQVHRRFEYALCRRCQIDFLANPLGMPRAVRAGTN